MQKNKEELKQSRLTQIVDTMKMLDRDLLLAQESNKVHLVRSIEAKIAELLDEKKKLEV